MLNYHKYNFCGNNIFQKQFLTKLNYASISKLENNLKGFEEACLTVLNSIAPLNCKFIQANQRPFMNKELQQAIIVRLKLRNKFLKSRSL